MATTEMNYIDNEGEGITHFAHGQFTPTAGGTTVQLDFTPKCIAFSEGASGDTATYLALQFYSVIDSEPFGKQAYRVANQPSANYTVRNNISTITIIPNGFTVKGGWTSTAYYIAVG